MPCSRRGTRRSGRIGVCSSTRRLTPRWSSPVDMPLYEYECDACGRRFEVIRKFSESELDACTLCGKGPVRRLLSSPAIQFKGTDRKSTRLNSSHLGISYAVF